MTACALIQHELANATKQHISINKQADCESTALKEAGRVRITALNVKSHS